METNDLKEQIEKRALCEHSWSSSQEEEPHCIRCNVWFSQVNPFREEAKKQITDEQAKQIQEMVEKLGIRNVTVTITDKERIAALEQRVAQYEKIIYQQGRFLSISKHPFCPCTEDTRCRNSCPHGLPIMSGSCEFCNTAWDALLTEHLSGEANEMMAQIAKTKTDAIKQELLGNALKGGE